MKAVYYNINNQFSYNVSFFDYMFMYKLQYGSSLKSNKIIFLYVYAILYIAVLIMFFDDIYLMNLMNETKNQYTCFSLSFSSSLSNKKCWF